MFHAIAERQVRGIFQSLSEGDYEPALVRLASPFEHSFAGQHALGGSRRTPEAFRAWFERLFRLFPNLDFEILSMAASGPPWNLVIVAEWIDRATPASGGTYENHGAHVIRIVRGRLASLHAYLDTQVLAQTLGGMAAAGVEEAAAPPIVDALAPVLRTHPAESVRIGGSDVSSKPSLVKDTLTSGTTAIGAVAFGALATGALAIGAVAIGRLTMGRLTIGRAKVQRLEIDELVIRRIEHPSHDAGMVAAPARAEHPHGDGTSN